MTNTNTLAKQAVRLDDRGDYTHRTQHPCGCVTAVVAGIAVTERRCGRD